MDKSEFRVLIRHCFLMGKILFNQSNGLIIVILTLFLWRQRLRGDMLTLNAVIQIQIMLNGQADQIRQLSRKTPKNSKLVLADRKLKLRKIAEELKISEGSVFTILHEHLSLRRLCSKWVQCLLPVDKKKCVNDSEHYLQLFQRNKKSFCINMGQWMKHGSTTSLMNQIDSQLSGQQQVKTV